MKIKEKILGVALIILGIIGIILPFMPGWIFILTGLGMLLPENKSQYAY